MIFEIPGKKIKLSFSLYLFILGNPTPSLLDKIVV
jgi:hypothetical protein